MKFKSLAVGDIFYLPYSSNNLFSGLYLRIHKSIKVGGGQPYNAVGIGMYSCHRIEFDPDDEVMLESSYRDAYRRRLSHEPRRF